MKELLIYSTVAGEIPLLVHKNIPKCFVEYEQYLELKAESDAWKQTAETFEEFYRKTEIEADKLKSCLQNLLSAIDPNELFTDSWGTLQKAKRAARELLK